MPLLTHLVAAMTPKERYELTQLLQEKEPVYYNVRVYSEKDIELEPWQFAVCAVCRNPLERRRRDGRGAVGSFDDILCAPCVSKQKSK
jgi:hypothetical protein